MPLEFAVAVVELLGVLVEFGEGVRGCVSPVEALLKCAGWW